MLLVDDDDRDDEEKGQVDAVQQHQEPLPDDPSGDQLLEGEGRAHGEVAICKFKTLIIRPGVPRIFKLADEEVGAGELSGAVDDVEKEGSDPEHGVDSPSVPSR